MARLRLMSPVHQTARTNLIEQDPQPLASAAPGQAAPFAVGHHAIETVRLDLGLALKADDGAAASATKRRFAWWFHADEKKSNVAAALKLLSDAGGARVATFV